MKIGYVRVSTHDQNLTLQIRALKAAGVERIFTDEGVSGGAVWKPSLIDALAIARPGDELIVWKLDRLSRSLRDLIATVSDLGQRGLAFRSLTENIETASPAGRFFFHVIGALAEFERDIIRERTREGLAAAKAAGKKSGRPAIISDEQWKMAKSLMDGPAPISATSAAKLLGVSRQAVHKRLKAD